jgi:xylulokinase
MYLLGYDIGSSSIKTALVEAKSGQTIKVISHPDSALEIIAKHPNWAEQEPHIWWDCVCESTKGILKETQILPEQIKGIGIAYQMHGLVCVDKNQQVLRPSIIWCDSRAVDIGNKAFSDLGKEVCLSRFLNSPGNFTASKLKWVKENEPEIFRQIHKIMLPGDFIAMKLTGEIKTTISGLSEGILWDFKDNQIAKSLLNYYGIPKELIVDTIGTFDNSGSLTPKAAQETGLIAGIPVTYRAGDQPNNALSLGVFNPNEVAATGGTSGVIYGVIDEPRYDLQSRINPFAHVNHTAKNPRLGLLLCINGAGIQYAWLKNQMAESGTNFIEMGQQASQIPIGSDGLRIIPFGNGAERILENKNPGAQINNLNFNRHSRAHFFRAGLEGIAFSFYYGFKILKKTGLNPKVIKVGNDNLFQSEIFSQTIANLLDCEIEVIKTTGAVGAAKASGIGAGLYKDLEEAMHQNEIENRFIPDSNKGLHHQAYQVWEKDLDRLIR